MKLYLLEYKEDAAFFLKRLLPEIRGREYRVVCFSPDPVLQLESSQVDYQFPEDVLPPERLGDLAASSWSHAQEFCDRMDREMMKTLPGLKPELPYFKAFCRNLKVVFDSCRLRIPQMKAVFEAFHPTEIHYMATKRLGFDHRMLWHDLESMYTHLIPNVAELLNPKPILFCHPRQSNRGAKAWVRRKALLLRPTLSALRSTITLAFCKDALRHQPRHPGAKFYCKMQGTEGFLRWVLDEMRKLGWKVFSWNPVRFYHCAPLGAPAERLYRLCKGWMLQRELRRRMQAMWKSVSQKRWFQDFFVLENVSWLPLIQPRLRYLTTTIISHAIIVARESQILVPHIDGLVGSYFHGFAYCAALLARSSNKSVIAAQHGPQGFIEGGYAWPPANHSLFYHSDVEMATHALRWGPGVIAKMEQHGETRNCTPLIVGAGHVERFKGLEGNCHTRRVLYAISSFNRNVYDFGIGSSTVNRRYVVARSIVDALCKNNGSTKVIVKTHPTPVCSSQAIVDYIFQRRYRVKLVQNGYFADMLKDVDAVVLDDVSSPLGEVIPTNLPIFAFTGSFRVADAAKRSLNRRVYFEENLHSFCGLLSRFVRNPDMYPPKLESNFEESFMPPAGIRPGDVLPRNL